VRAEPPDRVRPGPLAGKDPGRSRGVRAERAQGTGEGRGAGDRATPAARGAGPRSGVPLGRDIILASTRHLTGGRYSGIRDDRKYQQLILPACPPRLSVHGCSVGLPGVGVLQLPSPAGRLHGLTATPVTSRTPLRATMARGCETREYPRLPDG